MKCFSFILLLFSISCFALDEQLEKPLGVLYADLGQELTNGDLVILNLETDLTEGELKKYNNRFIQERIYALGFKEQAQGIFEVEAFISNPVKFSKKPSFPFVLKEIEIKFDEKRVAKSFQLFEMNYVKEQIKMIVPFVVGLVCFTLIIIYFYTRPDRVLRKKLKRRRKEKALGLVTLIESAKTRDDFEKIFFSRKDIDQLLDFADDFSMLYKAINEIQFKKEWSEQDLAMISSAKRKIVQVKVKNGI